MTSSHILCPLCFQDSYQIQLQAIDKKAFSLENFEYNNLTLKILLNPIPLTYCQNIGDHENIQLIREFQEQIYFRRELNQQLRFYQLPYGWDFFMQSLLDCLRGRYESAQKHFVMFLEIRNLLIPEDNRAIVQMNNQDSLNILYNQFFEQFKEVYFNIEKPEGYYQNYLLDQYELLIQDLEEIQLKITDPTKYMLITVPENFHRIQLYMGILRQTNNLQRVYTHFFNEFLRQKENINWINLILFQGFHRSDALWKEYFLTLGKKEKLRNVDQILSIFENKIIIKQLSNDTINIILMGKCLKEMKQQWLAQLMFSCFRKIYKQNNLLGGYMPYVYYQLSKLTMYQPSSKYFNQSLYLLLKSYEQIQPRNLKLYLPNLTFESFKIKILKKVLLLSIYLFKIQEIKLTCKLLDEIGEKHYTIFIFVNYCKFLFKDDNQIKYMKVNKYEQTLKEYFKEVICLLAQNQGEKIKPTKTLIGKANAIELDGYEIPSFSLSRHQQLFTTFVTTISGQKTTCKPKQCKIQETLIFKKGQNLIYNSLVLFFLITSNFISDIDGVYQHYNKQKDAIELFLQSFDCSNYQIIKEIFLKTHQFQKCQNYEYLLLCFFFMYIDEPQLCKEFLNNFKHKSQFYKKCTHKTNLQQFLDEIEYFELYIANKSIDKITDSNIHQFRKSTIIGSMERMTQSDHHKTESHANQFLQKSVTQSFASSNMKFDESIQFLRAQTQSFVKGSIFQLDESVPFSKSSRTFSQITNYQYDERQDYLEIQNYIEQLDPYLKQFWQRIEVKLNLVENMDTNEYLSKRIICKNIHKGVILIELNGQELVEKKLEIVFNELGPDQKEQFISIFNEIYTLLTIQEFNREKEIFLNLIYFQMAYRQNDNEKLKHQFTFYLIFPNYPKKLENQKSDQNLSLQIILDLFLQLEILHSHSIVHLDLKPSNILIKDDHAYIIDYGSAQFTYDINSKVKPTLKYQAPEIDDGKITCLADVFSLGCIICELFTQQKPDETQKYRFNEDLIDSLQNDKLKILIKSSICDFNQRRSISQLKELL